MDFKTTILSYGQEITRLLQASEDVMRLCNGHGPYPVVAADIQAPYVIYRRASLSSSPVKNDRPANAADVEVMCVAATYTASVELAEAVDAVLNGAQTPAMRSCLLSDTQPETYSQDGYVQTLVYRIRI